MDRSDHERWVDPSFFIYAYIPAMLDELDVEGE
jgi:hypothetical protein